MSAPMDTPREKKICVVASSQTCGLKILSRCRGAGHMTRPAPSLLTQPSPGRNSTLSPSPAPGRVTALKKSAMRTR